MDVKSTLESYTITYKYKCTDYKKKLSKAKLEVSLLEKRVDENESLYKLYSDLLDIINTYGSNNDDDEYYDSDKFYNDIRYLIASIRYYLKLVPINDIKSIYDALKYLENIYSNKSGFNEAEEKVFVSETYVSLMERLNKTVLINYVKDSDEYKYIQKIALILSKLNSYSKYVCKNREDI